MITDTTTITAHSHIGTIAFPKERQNIIESNNIVSKNNLTFISVFVLVC